MRRSAVLIGSFLLALLVALAGCGGGGSKSSAPTATSILFSPAGMSLNFGVVQALAATVLDQNGAALTSQPKITFTSSNTAVATVSTAGSVCAGVWDANFIVCAPGQVGKAQITATAGSLSASIDVYVHAKVDRVSISPSDVNCRSQNHTQQMTATAFSNGVDITPTVGPFNWVVNNGDVATVDSNGVVTAKTPGATTVYASVSAVSAVPANFVTCPVQTVKVHVLNSTDTTFSVAPQASVQLIADTADSAGNPVTVTLNWATSQLASTSVSASGQVTGVAAGTSVITATCSLTCNINLSPVYGNAVVGAVTGTSATTVYVAGTDSTSLIPIDTGTNTAGTAITLPAKPNSFVFASTGAAGFLGSSSGLMTLTTSTNTITNDLAHPGKVLAVAPNAQRVLVADTNAVYSIATSSTGGSELLPIAGATAADFTPDGTRALIVAGSTLYTYTPGSPVRPTSLAGSVNDVHFLTSGAFAYLAASPVTARAACNNALADTVAVPGTPSFLASTLSGSAMLAVDSPGIDVITASSSLAGCPPPLSDTVSSKNFGQGAFTARQLILLPSGAKAYVTSNLPALLVYDVTAGTTSTLPLAGGATPFTGGGTLDSATLYVGGSDNNVHRIDVAAGSDAQQISVGFTPDLVAVRPK